MSYSASESSTESGSPVELYDFAIGSDTYRFTSGEESITVDALLYEPLEIDRTTIIMSDEQSDDIITISMPALTPLVRRYINVVPGQQATLRIRRIHRTDVAQEFVLIYAGLVRAVAFTLDGLKAEVSVQPLTSGLSRTIPRYVFSGTCNHVLYDSRCKVDSNSFRYVGLIGSISAGVMTINGLADPSRPDGWATGGFVTGPTGIDFRLILSHVGDAITVPIPFPTTVGVGASVQVFAGCGHDIVTCSGKFSNVLNFGGFHWVPRENIFVKGVAQGS